MVVVLVAAGCGGGDEQATATGALPVHQGVDTRLSPTHAGIDLCTHLQRADVLVEKTTIDLGSAEARDHLVAGWGHDYTWGLLDHGSAVSALGTRSSLRFYSESARPLELVLHCWSPAIMQLPQRVTVSVNCNDLATLELGDRVGAVRRARVPAAAVLPGINTVSFTYAQTVRSSDVDPASGGARPLAACWDRLEIKGLRYARTPSVRRLGPATAPILVLPFGTRVDYYLLMGPDSELVLEGIGADGPAPVDTGLLVTVDSEDGGRHQVEVPALWHQGPLRLALPVSPVQPARLSLRAGSMGGKAQTSRRAGVRIFAPFLAGPSAHDAEPEIRAATSGPAMGSHPAPRPSIIIYLVDCLRADRVGAYGCERGLTPHIDAFAAEAVLLERCLAHASWTRPTVASLLTGLYPQQHGVHSHRDLLPGDVPYLPEILTRLGYRTATITTNSMISGEWGFDRGYDHFEYLRELQGKSPEIHVQSDELNRAVFRWLGQAVNSSPFFLYLHSTDPHAPYLPRQPFRQRFAGQVADPSVGRMSNIKRLEQLSAEQAARLRDDLSALYDAEIAYNDASFGELVGWLREHQLYDSSLIVLTADHGEELFEHGRWQHGYTLYQEQLHIPMIIKLPHSERAGTRVVELSQQADLLPTLLEYLGAGAPAGIDGRSLVQHLQPGGAPVRDPHRDPITFAWLARPRSLRRAEMLLTGSSKLIAYHSYDRPRAALELFDLQADPGEQQNLAVSNPIRARCLLSLLESRSASRQSRKPVEVELSSDQEEQLKALGYLQ